VKSKFKDGEPIGTGTVSNPIGNSRVYFDSSEVPPDVAVQEVGTVNTWEKEE